MSIHMSVKERSRRVEKNRRNKDKQIFIDIFQKNDQIFDPEKKENIDMLNSYMSERRRIRSYKLNYYSMNNLLPTTFAEKIQFHLEKIRELKILKGLDRPKIPQDMLWEIWWFIPASVKNEFVNLRHQYLSVVYVESIDLTFRYNQGKLLDMLDAMPTDKLIKFAQFGSPAKYHLLTPGNSINLYDNIMIHTLASHSDYNIRFYIKYHIINMIIKAYSEKKMFVMTALINSIIHVHHYVPRKYISLNLYHPKKI